MHIIMLLLCAIMTWQQTGVVPRARTLAEQMRLGQGYTGLTNPDALQMDDVQRWGRMLQVSQSQLDHMMVKYAEFVDRHNKVIDEQGAQYRELCALVGTLDSEGWDAPGLIPAMKQAEVERRKLQNELERLENEYIDSFVPVLNDEQIDLLYLLRNEASRRQSRSFHVFTKWANVDLRVLWDALLTEDVPHEDAAVINRILLEYEVAVTSMWQRAADCHWRGVIDIADLFADIRSGRLADGAEEIRRYQAARNPYGEAFERLRHATERAVADAEAQLSAPSAKRFVLEAKIASFPEFYPDMSCLDQLFEKLAVCDELKSADRKSVLEMHAAYRLEYSQACRELEALRVHWGDQQTRGVDGYQQFMAEAIQPLIEKREAVSTKWLQLLRDHFGADLIQKHHVVGEKPALTPSQVKATSAGTIRRLVRPAAPVAKPDSAPSR